MVQPIDYTIDVQTPFQAALQGYQGGAAIRADIQQQQQQQAARAQQAQMQADFASLGANPSPQAIASLSVRYPQFSEQFKRSYDMLSSEQQKSRLSSAIPIYAAIQSGRKDIAAQKLEEQAVAYENSGQTQEASQARAMARLVSEHPEVANQSFGLILASTLGPEKFAETFAKLGDESRAQDRASTDLRKARAEADRAVVEATYAEPKARADLQNTLSQVSERAGRLALDQDKLSSEVGLRLQEFNQKVGQLPDDARKLVNEATAGAVAAEQSAGQLLGLASKLEALGGGNGGFSSAWEWLKKSGGWQSDVSAARQEYVRLRNSQAIKSLPPGPATDKDIDLAMKGFPPETADSAYLASFLRGQAKLQQLEAAAETARSDWIGQVGSLTRPRKDINVDGVQVSAGTSFPDFLRGYAKRKSESIGKEAAISTRSYLRFANPSQDDGVR